MNSKTDVVDTPKATAKDAWGFNGFVRSRLKNHSPLLVVVVVILVLWQLSTYFLPPIVAPSLVDIWAALVTIVTSGTEFANLLYTAVRLLVALVASFIVGLMAGLVMGIVAPARRYLQPLMQIIQGVPSLSWVVFAVIWFSQVELRIAFILLIVTLPSFVLYIESAVRGVDKSYLELVHAFRAGWKQEFRIVIIPAIMPSILSSWMVNLGLGMRVVVIAELVGATTGVGYELLDAQSRYDMAAAIAWTVLLVVYLLLLQGVVHMIETRLLRWRPAQKGD